MCDPSDRPYPSRGKVSVVMPVHNAVTYIGESIDSLRHQTYTDWELIVVNDGSTDGSDAVVRAILSQDARVRMVHQDKKGPSAARNRGAREATGRFLYFLDADDLLESDAFAICVETLESKGLDAVTFDSLSFVDERRVPVNPPPSYDRSRALEDGTVYDMDVFTDRCYEAGVLRANVCLYMFTIALLGDLHFQEGSHYAEESLFCYLACLRTAKIAYSARPLHRRRWRADSLVGTATGRVMVDGYLVNLSVLQACRPAAERVLSHSVFMAATVNYLMQSFFRMESDCSDLGNRSAPPTSQALLLRVASRINRVNERLRKKVKG